MRLVCILAMIGCGSVDPPRGAAKRIDVPQPTPRPIPQCSVVGNLEVEVVDAWGRDLPGVRVEANTALRPLSDSETFSTWLGTRPADLTLSITPPDDLHEATTVTVSWNGSSVEVSGSNALLATGRIDRVIDYQNCPIFVAYVGLEHTWFASSAAPWSHNEVEVMHTGEHYWSSVADAVAQATDHVHWSTWWWESDFELVRDRSFQPELARRGNTVLSRLEARPAIKRVLVNRFYDADTQLASLLNTDGDLRDRGAATDDNFEVMLQGNAVEVPLEDVYIPEPVFLDFPARLRSNTRFADRSIDGAPRQLPPPDVAVEAASYHQKFLTVDGHTAFLSGMNTKLIDWDTEAYAVYDPRRSPQDLSRDEWEAIDAKETLPASPPRRDYGVKLRGPIVHDLEALFLDRWELAIDDGERWSSAATRFRLPPRLADAGVPSQLILTQPAPLTERSILESHLKAVRNARSYILIEDQYLRAPLVMQAIMGRMLEVPDLVLIAITPDVSDLDPAAQHTYVADATLRDVFGDRYLAVQLRSADLGIDVDLFFDDPDPQFQPISVHSKLRIVDDLYLSIGSCNFNNRGYLYEGEANVAVVDADLAIHARRLILERLVGPDFASDLTDDPHTFIDVVRRAAEANEDTMTWWLDRGVDLSLSDAQREWARSAPSGFVYPLEISANYLFDIGPDAF